MKKLCIVLTLACFMVGCKTPQQTDTLAGLGVQTASCTLAAAKPVTAVWIRSLGNVLKTYGSSTIPTPGELQQVISGLPVGTLNAGERALIINGVVASYQLAYADATPERAARLQALFMTLGNALVAGSECSPKILSAYKVVQPTEAELKAVLNKLEDAFKKVK